MANGWAPDGAVHDQIEDSVQDALAEARAQLPSGKSLEQCEACGEHIPRKRRLAILGVRTCLDCQAERDRGRASGYGAINRRGSKDSQLR